MRQQPNFGKTNDNIVPYINKYDKKNKFIIVINDDFKILYVNAYTLNKLGYSLAEFKDLKFNLLTEISETKFSLFYEPRKELHGLNRLRIYCKDFILITINVVYEKIGLDSDPIFVITQYEGKDILKADFLVSDIFFHSKDAMVIVDPNHIIMSANYAFTKMFGYHAYELKGKNIIKLLSPSKEKTQLEDVYTKVSTGNIVNFHTKRATKEGKKIDVEISVIPIDINHEFKGSQLIYCDLSNIVIKGQDALSFSMLTSNFIDGIMITNDKSEIIYVNNAFIESMGYTLDEVYGKKSIVMLMSSYHDEHFIEQMTQTIRQKGIWQGIVWMVTKNNESKPFWLQIFAIKSEDGVLLRYVSVHKDLSDMNVNKKILSLLGKDILTRLPNRHNFIEKVEQEILEHENETHYLVFFDINNFKKINDDYGHRIGDEILIEYSKRMMIYFKDHHYGRYGGDEFVVFLKCQNDRDAIEKYLEGFVNSLKTIEVDNYVFDIDLSIGYSTYPFDSCEINELIDFADQAMYVAKKNKTVLSRYKKEE